MAIGNTGFMRDIAVRGTDQEDATQHFRDRFQGAEGGRVLTCLDTSDRGLSGKTAQFRELGLAQIRARAFLFYLFTDGGHTPSLHTIFGMSSAKRCTMATTAKFRLYVNQTLIRDLFRSKNEALCFAGEIRQALLTARAAQMTEVSLTEDGAFLIRVRLEGCIWEDVEETPGT